MLTTFENAIRQSRRRIEREHHLQIMEEILRNNIHPSTESSLNDRTSEVSPAAAVAATDRAPLPPVRPSPPHSDTEVLGGPSEMSRRRRCKRSDEDSVHDHHHPDLRRRRLLPLPFQLFWYYCWRRGVSGMAAIGAIVAAVLLVGVMVVVMIRSSKQGEASDDDFGERYHSLMAKVLDWGITTNETFHDEDRAASRALRWLVLAEDPEGTVHLSVVENLRTRFALATLYYSSAYLDNDTSKTTWKDDRFWLSSYPVCWWHGIDCWENDFQSVSSSSIFLVRSVNLSSNNLIGSIPAELALLEKDLEILDLSYNNLGGSIPWQLGQHLVSLRQVYLCPNKLSSAIPASLFQLSNLTHLYLDNCQLSGTLPPTIGLLSNLQGLDIHNNYLTGSIPAEIGSVSSSSGRLRVLNLDGNALTGTIPASMGDLQGLVDLRLNNNRLRGPIPMELSNLRYLQVLYLGDNTLTGPLEVVDFSTLPWLVDVQLQSNKLVGTIPESILVGNLLLLKVVYLDGNKLTGPIPASRSLLGDNSSKHASDNHTTVTTSRWSSQLESVDLSKNYLTGPIPSSLWETHNSPLVHLRIYENQLTGSIPSEIGHHCVALQTLLLNNNSLQGTIPWQLGLLTQLRELHLHGNHDLSGVIPAALCRHRQRQQQSTNNTTSSTITATTTTAASPPPSSWAVVITADCLGYNEVSCSCCTDCY